MNLPSTYRFALLALLTSMPLPVIGYWLGSNYVTLLAGFVLLPLLDLIVGRDRGNLTPEQERALESQWRFRAGLYLYVPVHLALIAWGAFVAASGELSAVQTVGLTLSVGLATGAQGITIAHELGHKKSALDRVLARLLLVTVSYGHFYIEHNRGHHARVATHDDPATARYGESFYRFYPRALLGSFVSAWRLEAERLRRRQAGLFSWRNQMLWFCGLPALIALGFGLALDPAAALFFLGQSWMAFTLLEAINYVEHYGLVRERRTDGTLQRVTHRHSWNASEAVSNFCLINLQRHADHHAHPSRPYQILRHHDDSPQLPTGYAGMVLIALMPPLWFRLMNPRVEQLGRHGPRETAAA